MAVHATRHFDVSEDNADIASLEYAVSLVHKSFRSASATLPRDRALNHFSSHIIDGG